MQSPTDASVHACAYIATSLWLVCCEATVCRAKMIQNLLVLTWFVRLRGSQRLQLYRHKPRGLRQCCATTVFFLACLRGVGKGFVRDDLSQTQVISPIFRRCPKRGLGHLQKQENSFFCKLLIIKYLCFLLER
jgi:hypothetical protein